MRLAALALVFIVAACGGGGDAPVAPPEPDPGPVPVVPATMRGDIEVFLPKTENVLEQEPNNDQLQSHYLGKLSNGRTVSVLGHCDDDDQLDAFRALAEERVKLSISLEYQGTDDPDFIVWLWDFSAQGFVEAYQTPSPTVVDFYAKGDIAIGVSITQGSGDYILKIDVSKAPLKIDENEDGNYYGDDDDFYLAGRHLGEVPVDDFVVMQGAAHYQLDWWDSCTVVFPEAATAELTLFLPDTGSPDIGEYDIYVQDVTDPDNINVDWDDWAIWNIFDGRAELKIQVQAGTLLNIFIAAPTLDDGSGGQVGAEYSTYNLVVRSTKPTVAPTGHTMNPAVARGERVSIFMPRPGPMLDFPRSEVEFREGEVVVLHGADAQLDLDARNCSMQTAIPGRACQVGLDMPPGLSKEQQRRYTVSAASSLRYMRGARHVEPVYIYRPCREPDDEYYNLQWHYRMIRLPQAWDITTGSNDVIVAVIDTGETSHPDLTARTISGYDFISDPFSAQDGNGIDPFPIDQGDNPWGESSWHGTHVAGTVGAQTNNGVGVAGVTWATRLMHLRTLGVLGGTNVDIANAVLYAAGLENSSGTTPAKRADVINMSLGGPGYSQILDDACIAAKAEGVVIFAAAGNAATSAMSYPAGFDSVIAVGAVDLNKDLAPYSNFGSWVDFVAPGGDLSVDDDSDGFADGVLSTFQIQGSPWYYFYQGTSMACPHAAGVAALMLAVDPTLTPDQIEDFLKSTAEDLGAQGFDDTFGFGLINAYEALLAVQPPEDPNVPPALRVSTAALAFQTADTDKTIDISNVGGEQLTLTTLTTQTGDGGTWLQATAIPSGGASTDTSRIDVAVDRAGLADGAYFGRVIIESNGGDALVQVVMLVSTTDEGPPNVSIYVRAVNVDTGETAKQETVNPVTALAFTLDGLPPGRYRLEAGSDPNRNGVLGEEGELYGVYPNPNSPRIINLLEGDDRGPFSFTVGPSGALPGND
ncbi:MAG: S8 family peptidase [Planctomycetota bacterium]|jgi:subtilisin family serine protease